MATTLCGCAWHEIRRQLGRNRVLLVLLDDHSYGCQRVEHNGYRTQVATGSGGNFRGGPRRWSKFLKQIQIRRGSQQAGNLIGSHHLQNLFTVSYSHGSNPLHKARHATLGQRSRLLSRIAVHNIQYREGGRGHTQRGCLNAEFLFAGGKLSPRWRHNGDASDDTSKVGSPAVTNGRTDRPHGARAIDLRPQCRVGAVCRPVDDACRRTACRTRL